MIKWIESLLASSVVPLVLLAAWGCSGEPILEPVDGTVTLDGKPIADAAVLFQPFLSDGPPAHATTDSEGRFRLVTSNRSGVTAGKYRVAISKVEMRRAERSSHEGEDSRPRSGFLDENDLDEVYLLPRRYTDASISTLVADVQAESRNSFTFSLTTDETVEEFGGSNDEADEIAERANYDEVRRTGSSIPSE